MLYYTVSEFELGKRKRFGTNLILACAIFFVTYVGIRYSYSQFILSLVESTLAALSTWFILSIKKDGVGPLAMTILGCGTLILLGIVSSDAAITNTIDLVSFKTKSIFESMTVVKEDLVLFKEYVLFLTLFDFGIGLVLASRPTLLYEGSPS